MSIASKAFDDKKLTQTPKYVFPEADEYMDAIICIALLYGDTFRMAADQRRMQEQLEDAGVMAPAKFAHEHPADVDQDNVIV